MQHLDGHPGADIAVEHADHRHHAAVRVEIGIKHKRLQRRGIRFLGGRNMPHDRLQHILSPDVFLGAGQHGLIRRDGKNLLKLPFHPVDIGVRQVDLVDHRDDGQLLVMRQVDVGHRLGLDTLRRVHDQQCPLTGAQAPRHLVRKIDVPRRVDQIQLILHPVSRRVVHRDRMCLNGDAAFLLEIHRVEQLILHLPVGDGAGPVQQPVRKRRLPVVDVRNNAEITNSLDVHVHSSARPVVDHRLPRRARDNAQKKRKLRTF